MTAIKVTKCIQCHEEKRMFPETFLCEVCFIKYSTQLREKYGKRKSRRKTGEFSKWLKKAEENDVSPSMLRYRVYTLRMSFEDAIEMGRIRKAASR